MHDLTGQSIGKYQLTEQLGEGGMAVVYKAYDTRLERDVAIKLIRVDQFGSAVIDSMRKRFDREAKTLAKLTHPNIVGIIDYGEYEGIPYLVMEYLPGGTLKLKMGKPVPFAEAVKLLLPIANALSYAHKRDIIHRDIKPVNILFTASDEPMLTDFGIAKILDLDGGQTLTGTGVGIGTPEYMAPEQGIGKEVDGRSDIYSLGIVLYELVTGRTPFTADTPMAVVVKQMTEPLPVPSSIVPAIPIEVEHLLLKALAKNTEDRYQSMAEFSAAMSGLEKITASNQTVVPGKTIIQAGSTKKRGKTETHSYPTEDQIIVEAEKPSEVSTNTQQVVKIPRKPAEKVIERDDLTQVKKNLNPWKFLKVLIRVAVVIGLAILILRLTGIMEHPVAFVQTQISDWKQVLLPMATQTPSAMNGISSSKVWDKDGMVKVYIPAGEFTMGSPDGEGKDDEHPQHTVYQNGFWIDQTEVTNAMYKKCVDARACAAPSNTLHYGDSQYAGHPVVYVDWNQASAYCTWAGRELPTEAQWEKAARGTDGRPYPWGFKSPTANRTNFYYDIGDTTAVGIYELGKSPYGVYDMAGNVWEWVNDWYDNSFYQRQSDWNNPLGPADGTYRVVRGGSWVSYSYLIRSADRDKNLPSDSNNNVGFRCAFGESVSLSTPTVTLGVASSLESPKDGMVMLPVPAGKFTMGSPDNVGNSWEQPQHQVYLDAYWIDQTVVTNAMYKKCVESGTCTAPENSSSSTRISYYNTNQFADFPVIYVNWNQAKAYCTWAGRELPTEAQWEKASRGIDVRTYPWGNVTPTCSLANYSGCKGDTTAVGSFETGKSPYGAYGMAGNVYEWTLDWYSDYSSGTSSNPSGPTNGEARVTRGGSWRDDETYIRSAYRGMVLPLTAFDDISFRCTLTQ